MRHFSNLYQPFTPKHTRMVRLLIGTFAGLSITLASHTFAADSHGGEVKGAPTKKADIDVSTSSDAKATGDAVRDALGVRILPNKKLTVVIKGKPENSMTSAAANTSAPGHKTIVVTPSAAPPRIRQSTQARKAALAAAVSATAAHGNEVHWSYAGDSGPLAWGNLKPEFNLCAIGKRQSPINIEDGTTLQGPAEPIMFDYSPSNGTVVNNGHTIQVDVQGENFMQVRGSNYQLLQFHFHNPSEEQINSRRSAMVAHLVHKSAEGQLAVVAVLLEPGTANQLIDKVWTYMPLDTGDKVRMPQNLLNMNELLPADQRYYQFMGSLTTPPCSEGVLWMVMKQPTTISRAQIKLFSQLYPNNARPVQPVHARPVRDAQ